MAADDDIVIERCTSEVITVDTEREVKRDGGAITVEGKEGRMYNNRSFGVDEGM